MTFDLARIYALLPAIDRIRDAAEGDGVEGGPLRALLSIVAGEVAVLEENLTQLYEDQFVETCAEWVVPYIGDLLGLQPQQATRRGPFSQRALVANALAARRRKGTALMLEQVARDATLWPARAVELFQLLATTQSTVHVRPASLATVDLRQADALARLGTAFDTVAHGVDVRHIASRRGRYNIPNVAIFLWRLRSYPLTDALPGQISQTDRRRYLFSPLGDDAPLFTRPTGDGEFVELARQLDVPAPIDRRQLAAALDAYYGADRSIAVTLAGQDVREVYGVRVCDLSDLLDDQGNVIGWGHLPGPGEPIAIDPVLGRFAFPSDVVPEDLRVRFHYGFSADLGGGEYSREASFDPDLTRLPAHGVPSPNPTIQSARGALGRESGIIRIEGSGRFDETPVIDVTAGQHVALYAADERRPLLRLSGELTIDSLDGGEVTINGLLIAGGVVRITGPLRRLRLQHCTLVPGISLAVDGTPQQPAMPSLIVDGAPNHVVEVVIESSIVGPLRLSGSRASATVRDSIVDAPIGGTGVAIAGSDDGMVAGPPLTIEQTTVFGTVHVRELTLAANCIFVDEVRSARVQAGCVRFSYVPPRSLTPRRFRCQPDLASQAALDEARMVNPLLTPAERAAIASGIESRLKPRFTERTYGRPAFAQLAAGSPIEICAGAEDGAEMGAFHDLYQPQREANLRARLDEFLRFGLEAGILNAT